MTKRQLFIGIQVLLVCFVLFFAFTGFTGNLKNAIAMCDDCEPSDDYPSYDDYPDYPSYDDYPDYPSYDDYPDYPSYDDYPDYPDYPSYPDYPTPTPIPDECTSDSACGSPYSIYDDNGQLCGTCTPECTGGGPRTCSEDCTCTEGGDPPPAPTVTLKCNGSTGSCSILYNTAATLAWTPSGSVTSCTASGDWSGGKSVSGGSESTGNLTSSKTYSIQCAGWGGSSPVVSVDVNVGAAPVMGYFRCNGVNTPGTCNIDYGGTAAITWSSSNTTVCSLVSTVPTDDLVGSSGSRNDTNIFSNRDYSIECWNGVSGVHAPALPLPLRVVVNAPTVVIKANGSDGPITVPWNSNVTLSWTSTNAASCTASGDWSGGKALNSSESTGNLTQVKTYNYNLACSGNGSASDSVAVTVNLPVPNNPSNVTVTQPDYCVSGPAATINWTYSDPSGSPQQSYQVQIDDNAAFNGPEVDSGKINSGSTAYFTGQGLLQFNTNYWARVRVWNSFDQVSGWGVIPDKFKTPNFAYPQVNFTWTSNGISENPSPPLAKPVQFTDQTGFSGPVPGRTWSWTFGDGGSSTLQNPSYTYNTEGTRNVTLTATDNAGQFCSRTRGPLIIQKPIPRWREIAPQ